jgi:rhodanese-related sulfurtransferase
MTDITPAELKQRYAAGETPIILDVRENWENEEGRIDGSRNIPLGTLPDKLDDLEDLKEQEVIVHCKGGSRFKNVRNLLGGFQAYQQD